MLFRRCSGSYVCTCVCERAPYISGKLEGGQRKVGANVCVAATVRIVFSGGSCYLFSVVKKWFACAAAVISYTCHDIARVLR